MLPARSGDPVTLRQYRRVERSLAFVGFLLLFVGIRFFIDPSVADNTAVGHTTSGIVPTIWSLFFIVGGIGIVYGTQRPDPRIERAAVVLSFFAIGLNAVTLALIAVSPWALGGLVPHVLLLMLFAERFRVLTHLDKRAAESKP